MALYDSLLLYSQAEHEQQIPLWTHVEPAKSLVILNTHKDLRTFSYDTFVTKTTDRQLFNKF